nr:hypothetical protein [uncultured Flavobacterium sp.]
MKQNISKTNNIHRIVQFVLFVSSYLPLFILIIFSHVYQNSEYFYWSGISLIGIKVFVLKFGPSVLFSVLMIGGVFDYGQTLSKIEEVAKNGTPITVNEVKNKNNELVGYIVTYIILFLFQYFNGWIECFSVLFLMVIIYSIYINSSLLLINPLLRFKYAIFEFEFTENKKTKTGLIISSDKYLQYDLNIKIYEIGPRLYFAMNNNYL